MNVPVFSIIIPCYNSENYITDTLLSLKNQIFKNFEVVIIDDHSTDGSLAIANQCLSQYGLQGSAQLRPAHISKGVSNCRNYGVKISTGKWICFLDSDDLFYPEKLLFTEKRIAAGGDNSMAYHHSSRQFEDITNKTLGVAKMIVPIDEPIDIMPLLLKNNFINTSSVTISRNLLMELGGFDNTLHGIEDYMLWLRVAKRTKWFCSNEVLTDYRVRATSLMGGRAMSYYVTQNNNLLIAAGNYNEFSACELENIDRYLFDNVMNYYASQSINKGWADFIKGLTALGRIGKSKLAIKLLIKHLKFTFLRMITFYKK